MFMFTLCSWNAGLCYAATSILLIYLSAGEQKEQRHALLLFFFFSSGAGLGGDPSVHSKCDR